MVENPNGADKLAREMAKLDEGERIRRWRRGMRAGQELQRRLRAGEGPKPARAVAQLLSTLSALEVTGAWPGPRDPLSEQRVQEVRERWAQIQRHARGQAPKQGNSQALEAAIARATARFEAEVRRLARATLRAAELRLGAAIAGSQAGLSQRRPRQGHRS